MTDEKTESGRMLFDLFIHEAENIHNRVDWFLIFHAILFEGFLAAHYLYHRIALSLLGCLISYVWLVAGIRQVWNLNHFIAAVSDDALMGPVAGNVFKGLYEARRTCQPRLMRWFSSVPAFSIVLPIALLSTWLFLTITVKGVLAFLMAVVILSVFTFLWILVVVKLGPNFKDESIKKAVTHLYGSQGSTAR